MDVYIKNHHEFSKEAKKKVLQLILHDGGKILPIFIATLSIESRILLP